MAFESRWGLHQAIAGSRETVALRKLLSFPYSPGSHAPHSCRAVKTPSGRKESRWGLHQAIAGSRETVILNDAPEVFLSAEYPGCEEPVGTCPEVALQIQTFFFNF